MHKHLSHRLASILLALFLLTAGFAGLFFDRQQAHAASPTITEYALPTNPATPQGITAGPDGNLWFTEVSGNAIGRITPNGTATEYKLPAANSYPLAITSSAGDLWFTEKNANQIGRITTVGTFTEYPIPTSASGPTDITTGPDGSVWFTEEDGNKIAKLTPAGVFTEYVLPVAKSNPIGIAAGPDGNIWFTEMGGNAIGRMTPSGVITEFPIPSTASDSLGITAGSDGALWFTEGNVAKIGRITTNGAITEYPLPSATTFPDNIALGADGNLWFSEYGTPAIGNMSTSGSVTELSTPGFLNFVTAGPDGNVWFTDNDTNKVGLVTLVGGQPSPTPSPSPSPSPTVTPPPTTRNYVAMGDSFSSGEGNPPFSGISKNDGECHRSLAAYPAVIAKDFGNVRLVGFYACSGATTDKLTSVFQYPDQPPQIKTLSKLRSSKVDLVSLTIGGNDIQFQAFATHCVVSLDDRDCAKAYKNSLKLLKALPDRLDVVYTAIKSAISPGAKVVVLGYPLIVGYFDSPYTNCVGMDQLQRVLAVDIEKRLNQVIKTEVAKAGDQFSFLDAQADGSPFAGHDVCSQDPYFYRVDPIHQNFTFHPTRKGNALGYAVMVEAYLRKENLI